MDENMNMNEVVNNNNNTNNGNKSKLIIVIAILVVLFVIGGCLLAKRSNFSAKELYVGFLNQMKTEVKQNSDKLEVFSFAKGVMEVNTINTVHDTTYNSKESLQEDLEFYEWMYDYYKEEEDEYYKERAKEYLEKIDELKEKIANYDEGGSKDKTYENNIKLSFDKSKKLYFIERDEMKLLVDKNTDLVYTNDDNNQVVVASVPYEINSILNTFDEINANDKANELYDHIIDIIIKNLKDEYFVDGNKVGVNEYTIRMNKDQIIEFYTNIMNDLIDDKVFFDYLLEKAGVDSEDADEVKQQMKDSIKDFADEFKDVEKCNFELRTFLKGGRIEDFVRMEISLEVDDTKLYFEIKGEDNKSIMDSKEMHVSGYIQEKDQKIGIECSLIMNDNEISFEMVMTQEMGKNKMSASMRYAFETVDKKKFEDSSKIRFVNSIEKSGRKEEFSVVARSSDDKRLLDSKEIIIEGFADDEKQDGEFVISSKDNNAIEKSKEVVVSARINGKSEDIMFIKSNDENGIGDSHNLEFVAKSRDQEMFKIVLKTNDGKSFEETKDIEFRLIIEGEEAYLKFRTVDGKNFDETSGFEIEGQFEELKLEAKILSKENKSLMDSKLFNIDFNLDEGENHLDIKLDGNKIEGNMVTKSFYSDNEVHFKFYEDQSINLDNKFDTKNAKEITSSELNDILGLVDYERYSI